jgi:hypothetical protein
MPSSLPRTSTGLLAATAVISTALAGIPVSAQSKGITYPKAGVVCDQVGQVCYDSYGPSIGITKIYFGQFAADRLSQNRRGSTNNDFRLSSGQACSIQKRTCWDDGWGEKNVARGLTKQLFGSSNSSTNSNTGNRRVANDSGYCSLSQSGQRVFDGPCLLKQVSKGDRNRYRIQLENGTTYVFKDNGSGNYTITDSFGGSWPVTFVDHGNTGVFRFANYKLVATQNSGSSNQEAAGAALGAAVGNLLNNLFK